MVYVGYRPVLPGQNTNSWQHNYKGTVGTYSNWSLQSDVHLFDDVGDVNLPDHSAYARDRYLSQVYNGEFTYKPMELAKFSHGGQDAPYLRHINYQWQGVEGAETFPRGSEVTAATSASATLGAIATGTRDYSTDNLTFTILVDQTEQNIVLNGDATAYNDRPTFIAALNTEVTGATFTLATNDLVVTSDSAGENSTLQITAVVDPLGTSGIVELARIEGEDAIYDGWGHDGTRVLSTSRHSNWHFYGVPSADLTFDGSPIRYWGDPGVPEGFGRTQPYVYQGVADGTLENPGDNLAAKYNQADESNEYAHQRTKQWFGVDSAEALSV